MHALVGPSGRGGCPGLEHDGLGIAVAVLVGPWAADPVQPSAPMLPDQVSAVKPLEMPRQSRSAAA